MKVKFIEPMKLIRTKNFFYWKDQLYLDLDKKTKKNLNTAYELYLQSSSVALYSESDLKKIDFNKYYDLNLTEEQMIEYEYTDDIFGVLLEPDDKHKSAFVALRDRDYYELYDDELNFIKIKRCW